MRSLLTPLYSVFVLLRKVSFVAPLIISLNGIGLLSLPPSLLAGEREERAGGADLRGSLSQGTSFEAFRLPKIHVAPDGRGFVTQTGTQFVPFGVTYYRPGTGWAPQVWKRFDAEATRRDLRRLHALGANCVRVFLSFGSFYETPGQLSKEGLDKFEQFLRMAEEAGLYVQPTGPDHWEGLPAWAQGDRIADEQILSALEQFWRLFASRYRNRNALFAYELLNEPEVRWDTPAMRDKWVEWLRRKYGTSTELRRAWNVAASTNHAEWPLPPSKEVEGTRELLDYQHFREELAEEWTRRQTQAIKAADPKALVTLGLIQWSVPVCLVGSFQYSGFRPERQARLLDFLEVHFYPLAGGFYEYKDADSEARNLAYLESVVTEVAKWRKPVVLGEFGWYGGGKLDIEGAHPAATEEQQARWCRRALETTAGRACGWLNWGLYDDPDARDVSQLTGLLTVTGKEKAWGTAFRELAKQYEKQPMPAARTHISPSVDWNLGLTQKKAREEFLEEYIRSVNQQR